MVSYALLEVRCEVLPHMLIAHDNSSTQPKWLGYLLNSR